MSSLDRNGKIFDKALSNSEKRHPELKEELSLVKPGLENSWQELFPGQIIELAKPNDLRLLLKSSALQYQGQERMAVIELFGALAVMLHRPEIKAAAQHAAFYYSI